MYKHKTLGRKDMVLFTVSAILLLDTVAASASIGVASLFWWVAAGLIFFLPFGLVCAEMGCAYPEQGGIYAWVRNAFGGRWGSRVSWSYWVNNALYLSATFILFAGIFRQLFFPALSLFWQVAICITLTWITVFINIISLDIGKWIPNLGAILKIVIFIALGAGGINYALNNGMANEISLASLIPDWGSGLQYLPVIIYGILGFELVSAGSEEMKDPARDVPSSILISGLIIILCYLFGTAAVLAAIPVAEINLVEGLIDTLSLFMGDSAMGKGVVLALGVALLFTLLSNSVTWAMGANRAAAQAAQDRELPSFFGIESKTNETPVGAALALGSSATVLMILYGVLANSNEDLFWSVFAFGAVIFFLPYLGLFAAFIKMRRADPDRHRPFRVPGGPPAAYLFAFVCSGILAVSIFLFTYVPGGGIQWPVLIGVVTLVIVGELFIRYAEKEKANSVVLPPESQ